MKPYDADAFNMWLADVNGEIRRLTGENVYALRRLPRFSLFEDGTPPEQAARLTIQRNRKDGRLQRFVDR